MATTIQLCFMPGTISFKLPFIVGSLMQDCHFQVFDVISKYISPIITPVTSYLSPFISGFGNTHFVKHFVKEPFERLALPSIRNWGRVRWFLKTNDLVSPKYNFAEGACRHFRLLYFGLLAEKFNFFNQKLESINRYGATLFLDFEKRELLGVGNLALLPGTQPVIDVIEKLDRRRGNMLGRIDENITRWLVRN